MDTNSKLLDVVNNELATGGLDDTPAVRGRVVRLALAESDTLGHSGNMLVVDFKIFECASFGKAQNCSTQANRTTSKSIHETETETARGRRMEPIDSRAKGRGGISRRFGERGSSLGLAGRSTSRAGSHVQVLQRTPPAAQSFPLVS
jgi:hypothetical protein